MISLRGNIEEVMFCSLNSHTLLWGKISNFDIFQIDWKWLFLPGVTGDWYHPADLSKFDWISCRKKAQQDATHMDILIFKAMHRNFWEHPANSSGFMEMWFPIISNIVIVLVSIYLHSNKNSKKLLLAMRFLWRKSPFSRGEELKLAQRGERFGTGKGTSPLHRTVGQLFQVWSGFFREFLCPKPKIKEQGCDSIFYMFVEEWLKPVSCSSPSQNCMCCNIL